MSLKDSWVALDVIQSGLWSPTMDVEWCVRHPPGEGPIGLVRKPFVLACTHLKELSEPTS